MHMYATSWFITHWKRKHEFLFYHICVRTMKLWSIVQIFTKSQYSRKFLPLSLAINIYSIFIVSMLNVLTFDTYETILEIYSILGWNIFSVKYFENPNNELSTQHVGEIWTRWKDFLLPIFYWQYSIIASK